MAARCNAAGRVTRGTFLKTAAGVAGAIGGLTAIGPRDLGTLTHGELGLDMASTANAAGKPLVVYFGTGARGAGIHTFDLDPETGKLTQRADVTPVAAPGWIDLDRSQKFLYASIAGSKVASFAIDTASGALSPLNEQVNGTAGAPHLSIHGTGRWVVTASYGGGTVSLFPVGTDGRLGELKHVVVHAGEPGPHPDQPQPRAHQCPFDLSGRWVAVPDLGLDRVYVYSVDTTGGSLVPNDPWFIQFARGRGPRHIAFHPNGKLAYLINELSSEMTALSWDSDSGVFRELQTLSTLPDGWSGRKWSAQVIVHPNGRFVYGSNRGSGGDSDDIAIFRIDEASGLMTPAGHAGTLGRVPRNFVIDPSGRFLICAHQDSDNVVVFAVDGETGALTPTGHSIEVVNAICTQFAPIVG
ncbi:MAG: lactonase family protein [Chloroflexota bacterium]